MTAQTSWVSPPDVGPAYNKEQIMLTFSFMSYYGFGLAGDDASNAHQIRLDIEQALTRWRPVKNEWSLVWGPGLFRFHGDRYDDNLVFIVHNSLTNEFVVTVRGTNPLSLRDWLFEDFEVARLVNWEITDKSKKTRRFQSSKPKISRATSIGLSKLLVLTPESGLPGEGQTIVDFFNSMLSKNTTTQDPGKHPKICVTGHSLGGALAPTLALWLKERQGSLLLNDVEISTVAFAGPSAGNKEFAQYSDKQLGGHCTRIANSLDVVPHAWNTRSVRQLYFLYEKHFLFPSPLLFAELSLMLIMSFGKGYTQIRSDVPALEGRYKPLIYNFFAQAIYQHTVGYLDIMGLDKEKDIPLIDLFAGQLEL